MADFSYRRALFIADSGNQRIKMLDGADMSVYAIFDGLFSLLEYPRTGPADDDNWETNYYLGGHIATDGLGGMAYDGRWLYVGENTTGKIYKADPRYSETELPVVKISQFPSKPEGSGDDDIYDMCYWSGHIYVTNRCATNTTTQDDIHIFETEGLTHVGTMSIPWAGGGGKPVPTGICTDGTYLYVLEGEPTPRIHKFYLTGEYVKSFGKYGTSTTSYIEPEFYYPTGIDTDGTTLYVLDAYSGNWRVNFVSIGSEKQYAQEGSYGCTDSQFKDGTVLKLDNIGKFLCVANSSANCPRVLKWHIYDYNGEFIAEDSDLDTAKSIAVLNPLVAMEGSITDNLFIANTHHPTIWDKDQMRAIRKLGVPLHLGITAPGELRAVASYDQYLYALFEGSNPGYQVYIVKYLKPDYTIEAFYDYSESGTYNWSDVTCMTTDGTYLYILDWYSTSNYYSGEERGMVQKWKCSDLSFVDGAYLSGIYPPYAEDEPFPGHANYLFWPTQIDTDGIYLYVTSYDDGNIVRLNCSDLSYVDATTDVNNWGDTPPASNNIHGCLGMCVSPDGMYIYYAESWDWHRMTKRRADNWDIEVQLDNTAGPYGNGFGYTPDVLLWNHGMTTDGEHIYFGSGGDWFDPMVIRKHNCSSLSFVDWAGYHSSDYDVSLNPWIIEDSFNLDCAKTKMPDFIPLSGGCPDTVEAWVEGTSPGSREVGWIPFHMLELYFPQGNFFISNSDRPLVWEGNSYACFPFTVEPAKHSAGAFQETTKVSASNIDRSIASLVMGEQLEGKRIIVRKSYWTKTFTHTLPYVYFDGQVEGISIAEDQDKADVSFELKNDYWNWQHIIPRRTYNPDSGFTHMSKLEDYKVWWGLNRESSD